MNVSELFEAVGPLYGLPKHWIAYIANRWGKGYNAYYANKLGGEHSSVTLMKDGFNPEQIKKALKDPKIIAVIGKIDGEPLFMITPHEQQQTKYRIFEVKRGIGVYDAKGRSYGTSRRNSKVKDSYTMNEVVEIADTLGEGKDFAGLTIETISVDPNREVITKQRQLYADLPEDPMYTAKKRASWQSPELSKAQLERAKKYGEIKRPKLDARIDVEVQKIKDQMGIALDKALETMIKKVKSGYTFSVNKETLANEISKALDTSGIERLAAAYSAINVEYTTNKTPLEMSKALKRTGLA